MKYSQNIDVMILQDSNCVVIKRFLKTVYKHVSSSLYIKPEVLM